MKRLIKILSLTTMCLLLVLGCFACNDHVHTFDKNKWESNETMHWRPATCEHTDEKDDEAAHVDQNDDGKCDVCQRTLTTTPPAPHTHSFDMDKWDSNETTHWHPANCGHPEQKNGEAAHTDTDNDGKCDVCQRTLTTTPPEHTHNFDVNKWDSDENTHWHPADCGDPTHRDSEAEHEDNDEDGKCDVCQREVPVTHEHIFDEDVWESNETTHWHPAKCNHPEQKGNEAEHEDTNNDGKCDVCGYKDAAFYTQTVSKVLDKIATDKNFTLTLNAKINGDNKSLTFKFAENGFDFPTFKSKEIHDEEGKLTAIVRTTINMRDNAFYVLDETYTVTDNAESEQPTEKILNKVALPEEIKELDSLFTTLKEYVKTKLADVDFTFLDFEETENGYILSCDTDVSIILNMIVPILVGIKDMPLNDIISQLLSAVMGAENFNLASIIKSAAIMLDGKSISEIVTLLDTLLPSFVENTTLESLINTVVTTLGIEVTPQSIYGILGKLGLEIPEPTESETLGSYIIKILQSEKIGNIKLDDIVKKITGDENATLKSVLTKLADFLENTTISKLLPFIPFEKLEGMTFTQFKLYLKIETDKEYAITSLTAGIDGKYTFASEEEAEEQNLELSCGFAISDKGETQLSQIEEALLNNNLKFADDNVLDSTILTTVVKALVNKYIGGTISIDELKTYYTKIVTLIKSSSINEKVLDNLGFAKSEADENGNYVLSRDLIDLLPIITPLVESLSPAMKEGLDSLGDNLGITVTNPLTEVPFALSLLSLIDVDLGEDVDRGMIITVLFIILPQLENIFNDSLGEESVLNLKSLIEMLNSLGLNLIDTVCDFFGISMDTAYNFFKEKYDENLATPLAEETISAYMARCLGDEKSEYFSEKLGKVTINRLLSDITGSDFYTWFHENVQALINFMLAARFSDIDTLDISLFITVDQNHVVQSVELAICYSGHAEPFNEDGEAQDLADKFTLLKFTANV